MTRTPYNDVSVPHDLAPYGYVQLSALARCPGCGETVRYLYVNPRCEEPRCRACFLAAQSEARR